MALCENCKNKSCGYASEDVIRCGDFEENLVQTNADSIRAMSDDELATDLLDMFEEICEDGVPCKEWMLDWLKRPAKEDAE